MTARVTNQDSKANRATAIPGAITRAEYIYLIILVIVCSIALGVRLYRLGSFPANLMADEADNLGVIYTILAHSGPGPFGLDWKPSPAFSMWVASIFVYFAKNDLLGLRLPSALFSVLALPITYLLYRRYIHPVAAILALTLMSFSVWYLNFSRSGWENVNVVLLTSLALLLLHKALEKKQWKWWILTGFITSLGLYSYFSGRAILLSLIAYAPIAILLHRKQVTRIVAGYGLLIITAIALFIPQLPSIAADPARFNIRAERVSVLNAAEDGYFGHYGIGSILLYQIQRNARFFFDGSVMGGPAYSPPEQPLKDTRPRYSPFGKPLLDPVTALLFALGMILSLFCLRNSSIWWVSFLVPWFFTQVLSINTPDAARGIGMIPSIYFFVGLALDKIIAVFKNNKARSVAIVISTFIIASISIWNTIEYFNWASSPEFLEAREPAVPLSQFEQWSKVQQQRAQEHLPPLTVTEWKEIHGDN